MKYGRPPEYWMACISPHLGMETRTLVQSTCIPSIDPYVLSERDEDGDGRGAVASNDLIQRVAAFTQGAAHLDLHREPGQQMAGLIHSIFELQAVAIFNAP